MFAGSLKYTGTDILVRSFPMESLIIVQTLIFIFGSLKKGSISLLGGSISSYSFGFGAPFFGLFYLDASDFSSSIRFYLEADGMKS